MKIFDRAKSFMAAIESFLFIFFADFISYEERKTPLVK